jgi:hypothetical protein
MGMWSKDALYGGIRLDQTVTIGTGPDDSEKVLLLDAVIVSDEVPTDIGFATKTALLINKLSADGTTLEGSPIEVNCLAQSIAEKVKEKADGDMPIVVVFFKVETKFDNDATVMQATNRWDGKVPKFEPLVEGNPF